MKMATFILGLQPMKKVLRKFALCRLGSACESAQADPRRNFTTSSDFVQE